MFLLRVNCCLRGPRILSRSEAHHAWKTRSNSASLFDLIPNADYTVMAWGSI
jgi:hypothetical protein